MVANIEITRATEADAFAMVTRLNKAHAESIIRLGDGDVETCILRDFHRATHKWVAKVDGQTEAMWGVYPTSILTGIGYPWLFGSERMRRCARLTLVVARHAVRDMLTAYPRLFGVVDGDFDASVRFARRVGFTVKEGVVEGHYLSIAMRA